MRILQVIHDFVPETLAGAEINTHKLSSDLAARGHEVYVFCRGWNLEVQPYNIRDEEFDGLKVRRLDFGTAGKAQRITRHDLRVDQAFREYLAIAKPDLIHFQHFIYLTTDLLAIAKETGVPIFASLRNFYFRCPVGTRLYHDNTLCNRDADLECLSCIWPDMLSRKRKVIPWPVVNPLLINLYRAGMGGMLPTSSLPRQALDSLANWETEFRDALLMADIVHCPSQFLADMIIEFGIPRDRVKYVENGIRFDPSVTKIKPAPSGRPLRLGQIGTSLHKGTYVAVEAMRYLPFEAAELKVYGKLAGRDKSKLEALAQGANVQFAGPYQQSQIFDIFGEMDALIVPSIWYENCPTVIREAFAAGTPVITSGIGGMAEAVRDGVDGLHFEVNNARDLAEKLQQLIDNPALIHTFSANVQPPPTAEWVSDQIAALYQTVMDERERRSSPTAEQVQGASVIIPAYNEEKYIGVCLESLSKQTHPQYEVIVVDDGSTDRTVSIVEAFAAKDKRFKLLKQSHKGPGEARNLAANQATGDVLLFCDADMAFAPDYIEKLIAPIVRGECVGTFSKEEYVKNYTNMWARSWHMHDGLYDARRHPPDWPDEHDVYRAVDRKAFMAVGGFSPKGSGDDHTISQKLGALAKAAPGAICYHYNPDTPAEVFQQARWYARGRRIPFSWKTVVTHTPPFSIARSIKRAIRYHNPVFPVFKLIHDYGIVRGLLDKKLKTSGHGR